jgi:hypothetical protein
MKTVVLQNEDLDLELSVNVIDSWNEITLEKYFELSDLELKLNQELDIDIDNILDKIVLLSDAKRSDLNNYSVLELSKIVDILSSFGDINKFDVPEFIMINDIMYIPKKNIINLTSAEVIYIKQMQKNSKSNMDVSLSVLSILVRPGYKKEVDGKIKYIQYPLEDSEIEERKKLFLSSLKITETLPLLDFFLNGIKG